MRFAYGSDEATELTERQVLEQMKMYSAALRIADRFGCAAIGIQYQQGLKDLVPASDLAEGLLNDPDRPPVRDPETGEELYAGRALPHFNEVDEGCAVDAVITNRVWTAMGLDPSTTLHDVRWGDPYGDDYVWVFEISGAVPPSHLVGGYAGAVSERQSPMYFRLGGGTIKGVSKPGEIVWSRVFVMDGQPARGHRAGHGRDAPGRGDRAALAGHHPAVADHARGAPRRQPRPDDGAGPLQPHPGRLRARRGDGRPGARREGVDVPGAGIAVHLCGTVLAKVPVVA